MHQLTLDDATCRRFSGMLEPMELRDPSGKLLGVFTPHVPPELLARYAKAKELFSSDLEELERNPPAKGEGIPLSEVWKRIRAGENG